MKRYLTFLWLIISYSLSAQNCSIPSDGKYSIEYNSPYTNDKKQTFTIKNNKFFINDENGVLEEYEIIVLSNCMFRIESKEKIDESKLTDFQKILAKLKPFYDIIETDGNTYFFILRIDMHIQICSGKFILIGN